MGPKDNNPTDTVRPINAPAHVDLGGVHGKVVRISGRTRWAILAVCAALLAGLAYGGYQRTKKVEVAAREAGLPAAVTPAISAEQEFLKKASAAQLESAQQQPSSQLAIPPATVPPLPPLPEERVVVVRPAPVQAPASPAASRPERTEEQQLEAAIAAPTGIRSSSRHAPPASPPWSGSDLSAMGPSPAALVGPRVPNSGLATGLQLSEYDVQNAQSRKEEFLFKARQRQAADYLGATREAPLSRYEIKAGWEIPATLEQALNSDLPGELKALVASNVYDTATGMYLLIPQGSRLLGKYDSRISYGQDAVQVAWNRIIYPDASSVDLDGMVGLDSHGNAGLHDKVDRHYRRLIGFSALTSLMTAAYAISQQRNQTVLVGPTPAQSASTAVGEELSRTGSELTRRNLNVQPTLKVPAGYRFVVRVNKDILFDEPYRPEPADPLPLPRTKSLNERARN